MSVLDYFIANSLPHYQEPNNPLTKSDMIRIKRHVMKVLENYGITPLNYNAKDHLMQVQEIIGTVTGIFYMNYQ